MPYNYCSEYVYFATWIATTSGTTTGRVGLWVSSNPAYIAGESFYSPDGGYGTAIFASSQTAYKTLRVTANGNSPYIHANIYPTAITVAGNNSIQMYEVGYKWNFI
jgi:hypothetical protein